MKRIYLLLAICAMSLQGYSQKLDIGTYTDHSGTTSAGSKTAMAASGGNGRVGWFFQNQSGDGTVMYINFTSAASASGDSFKLIDGASATSVDFCTTELITVYCASSGKAYCIKEFIGK